MAQQQSLFGPEPPEPDPPRPDRRARRSASFGAATVAEDLREVASLLPDSVRLGASSWSFPGWVGSVWDRKVSASTLARRGLGVYAEHPLMRSVGLDRGYYAPVPLEAYQDYAAAVPGDFRFLVKALDLCVVPRFPDHARAGARRGQRNPEFLDPSFAARTVIEPLMQGLGDKAGPLVFQFSAMDLRALGGAESFLERLHDFLAALPPAGQRPEGLHYVVELRNSTVLGPDYARALRSAGAVHCFNLHPSMPGVPAQLQQVEPAEGQPWVVRWMLHRELRYREAVDLYEPFDRLVDEDPQTRGELAQLVHERSSPRNPAFLIVNNKAEGSSPWSVSALAREIVARRAPAA